jgi:predicted transposase YbfD/YdcC
VESFAGWFAEVPDPRASNARHDFLEVMFIALAATLCGAETCSDMSLFARSKLDWLRQILTLPHGAPSHDTFSRVFRLVEPEPFEAAFSRFTKAFAGELKGVVAIDGKALRGAYERGRRTNPLHLVNVWAAEARLVIGQRLAPGRNEVKGALEAVALLSLEGCMVTADALHCHAAMAKAVTERGGDYALALKDNQAKLLADAKARIEAAAEVDFAQSAAVTAHDRSEMRRAVIIPAVDFADTHGFPGAQALARVEGYQSRAGREQPAIVRHFILSRMVTADEMIDIARTHWTIENQLHWVLDVAFDEDRARSRKDHAPQNLALLRKLALNLLRANPDKGSIRGKIKRAGWDEAFLNAIIAQMR